MFLQVNIVGIDTRYSNLRDHLFLSKQHLTPNVDPKHHNLKVNDSVFEWLLFERG